MSRLDHVHPDFVLAYGQMSHQNQPFQPHQLHQWRRLLVPLHRPDFQYRYRHHCHWLQHPSFREIHPCAPGADAIVCVVPHQILLLRQRSLDLGQRWLQQTRPLIPQPQRQELPQPQP